MDSYNSIEGLARTTVQWFKRHRRAVVIVAKILYILYRICRIYMCDPDYLMRRMTDSHSAICSTAALSKITSSIVSSPLLPNKIGVPILVCCFWGNDTLSQKGIS